MISFFVCVRVVLENVQPHKKKLSLIYKITMFIAIKPLVSISEGRKKCKRGQNVCR